MKIFGLSKNIRENKFRPIYLLDGNIVMFEKPREPLIFTLDKKVNLETMPKVLIGGIGNFLFLHDSIVSILGDIEKYPAKISLENNKNFRSDYWYIYVDKKISPNVYNWKVESTVKDSNVFYSLLEVHEQPSLKFYYDALSKYTFDRYPVK